MNKYEVLKSSNEPITVSRLIEGFKSIGIEEGMTLIVHSSLSSIGWVCGGAVAVIDSLIECIGKKGNLVMPSHSGDYSEPSYWCNPSVPKEWYDVIRNEMPVFNSKITPCRGMGVIAQTFLNYDGVIRSNHPQVSFSAYGRDKEFITDNHKLDYGLSDTSPLGRLYELDAKVLLIGVLYTNNTSFHLGEYRSNCRDEYIEYAPILENGERLWKGFKELEIDSDGFEYIGECFEKEYNVLNYKIGNANCKLFSQRECVDFATKFLSFKRS